MQIRLSGKDDGKISDLQKTGEQNVTIILCLFRVVIPAAQTHTHIRAGNVYHIIPDADYVLYVTEVFTK